MTTPLITIEFVSLSADTQGCDAFLRPKSGVLDVVGGFLPFENHERLQMAEKSLFHGRDRAELTAYFD